MGLLIPRRKDSGTRNCFFGDTSGPYIWGKENHTPGISRSQEESESLPPVWGLNRSEGLCGMAEDRLSHESLALGLLCGWNAARGLKFRRNETAQTGSRGCSNWYRTLLAKQLYVNPAVDNLQGD